MAIYAIGDVHGCHAQLLELLARIAFRPGRDRLWFVGDLINRGPDSLAVLRFVRELGDDATVILGNHESRALGGLAGSPSPIFKQHMKYLLDAPDLDEIHAWLKGLRFFHRDRALNWSMVHGGIHPHWSLAEAEARSEALAVVLSRGENEPIAAMLRGGGDLPAEEPPASDPMERLRYNAAVFTRIRLCSSEGRLLWPGGEPSPPSVNPYALPGPENPYQPWFTRLNPLEEGENLLYGHWAMAGLTLGERTVGLDGGCVYGGKLHAMRLDDPSRPVWSVPCPRQAQPGGD
ncbi:MAG: symmetrical bis(5'-nucleosyl)-tetraphosphatase [Magnetococcales bacterium]|nr:symmetrical bis(5'-nucleosyl)-tetraphosphatase [Magnetococcales bacterium]